jgi:hypothetical protein
MSETKFITTVMALTKLGLVGMQLSEKYKEKFNVLCEGASSGS